jgi:PAS domain-containing protein
MLYNEFKKGGDDMGDMNKADDMQYKVLQLIPTGVGVYDVTDTAVRKVYLNDGYYQMISADKDSRHQYDGTRTVDAVHREDVAGLIEEARASIRENRMLEYSFRVLTGDGGFRWIAIRANHIPAGEGTERFFAAYYDIDELVRTRDKLRENDIIFSDALVHSDIIHFIFYPDSRRCEMVAIPEKYKDLPAVMEDFPESCIHRFDMNKENAHVLRQAVSDILAGSQETECIVSMNMQRRHYWYRIHLQAFRDHKGNDLRIIGNAQNVDSFKAAERNFNEEKLRMQSLESGILATSCFNVTRDQSIDVNNSEIFNYSRTCDRSIHEEAIRLNPEIGNQDPSTLSVLLSGAEEIPDKKQRLKFLETCSHIGMIKNYEAGNREMVLEYRRQTGRGLIWVSTRIVMLPDPETRDVLAFYYTRDINDEKIRQEVAASLVTHNYINASYIDLETGLAYQPIESSDHAEIDPEGEDFDAFYQALIPLTVYPEDQEKCRRECRLDNIVAALEQNGSYTFSYRERDPNGEKPYRLTLASAYYLNEEKRYIVISRSDITEQYEYEQQQKEILRKLPKERRKPVSPRRIFCPG